MELVSVAALEEGGAGGMLEDLLALNDALHRALDDYAYVVKRGPRRVEPKPIATPASVTAPTPATRPSPAKPAPAPAVVDDDDFFSSKCMTLFTF